MDAARLIEDNVSLASKTRDGASYWQLVAAAHEATIDALCDQLAKYTGRNATPSERGFGVDTLSLGDADVVVEHDLDNGIVAVLLNGEWHRVDVLDQDVIDSLNKQLDAKVADEVRDYLEGVAADRVAA